MARSSSDFDFTPFWRSVSALRPPRLAAGIGCLWAVLGLFVLITLGRSFVLVGAGERAVLFNRFTGIQPYELGEGLHFLLPWVQFPTLYDVKTHTYTMHASQNEANEPGDDGNDAMTALTSDGLPVSLDLSVLFHVTRPTSGSCTGRSARATSRRSSGPRRAPTSA